MAQIAILYDTMTKQLRLIKDGEAMDAPRMIEFFKNFDDSGYSMRAVQVTTEEGKTTEVITTATKMEEGKKCKDLKGDDLEECQEKSIAGPGKGYPQCDKLDGTAKENCIRRAKQAEAKVAEIMSEARDYPGKKKKKKGVAEADLVTPETARIKSDMMNSRIEKLIKVKTTGQLDNMVEEQDKNV